LTLHILDDYQLAFFTPGSIPLEAKPRKHKRHMLKNLINPRDRPHKSQRLCLRVENFGFRLLFSINAFLAIVILAYLHGKAYQAPSKAHTHGHHWSRLFG